MKKIRFTALMLVFALLLTSIQPAASAEAAAGEQTVDNAEAARGDDIQNPENGKWSYIYFGSYPQTEVTGEDLTDAIKNAYYNIDGNAMVGDDRYHRIYTIRSERSGEKIEEYLYFKWEPIRWRVLQKTDDTLLVMSDIGLDNIPYHTETSAVAWNESRMRNWLNDEDGDKLYEPEYTATDGYEFYAYASQESDIYIRYPKTDNQEKIYSFYMTAFEYEERNAIKAQGEDKIFLLSAEDVKNPSYGFGTADKLSSRVLQASEYAHKKGAQYWGGNSNISRHLSVWWLRPDDASSAAIVFWEGQVQQNALANDKRMVCAPAMYISLDSDQWISEVAKLAEYKENALNTLLYAHETSDYYTEEGVRLFHALREGRNAIDQAADFAAVDNALAAAEAKIGEIKTIGHYSLEEALAAGDSLNPVHHHDTSMKDSEVTDFDTLRSEENPDYTDWNYIYFGAYPESEVTDRELLREMLPVGFTSNPYKFKGQKYWGWGQTWYAMKPIKWRILRVEENQLFLVSDEIIDAAQMGKSTWVRGWDNSDLQIWLNTANTTNSSYFLKKAFSEKELEAIVPYPIDGRDNRIYMLSKEEATNEEYGFCPDADLNSRSRQMWGTKYANDGESDETLTCWLRTTAGSGNFDAMNTAGSIGTNSVTSMGGVVPALRLSLDEQYASCWSLSEPTTDADIKAVLDAWDGLEALYSKEDYSETQWAKVQESLDEMLEGLMEWKDEQEITDITGETKKELDEIPTKQQEEQSALQDAKDAAKAELESCRADNDKYSEEKQQERETIITEGIAAIEAAQDADAVAAALQKAKDDLAKIGEDPVEETVFPQDLEEKLRNRTFKTIDDETQGMYSADRELTIEVFTRTTCAYSGPALQYLQQMNLPEDKVDIFSIEVNFANKEAVRSYAEELNTPGITYCYDVSAVSQYLSQAKEDLLLYSSYYLNEDSEKLTYGTPTYVFRDNTGKILKVAAGCLDTEELTELLESIGYGELVPEEKEPGKEPGYEEPDGTTIEAEFDVTYSQTDARQMFSRVNEFRTGDGAWEWNETDTQKVFHTDLGELTYDYELEKVAMQRAADLVAAYSHTRPDETSCFSAYPSAFKNMSKGENIAIGYRTEEAVFTAWKEEDEPYIGQGHRRNMLSEGFQTIGIAHVVYNGCNYWVQEFGGKVVSAEVTPANDSKTTVKVPISKNVISVQELKTETKTVEMKAGESQPLPQVYTSLRTKGTWEYAPSLEFPVTTAWSVSSGEDVVRISDGTLYALKEGDAKVTATYNGKTTEIQINVAGTLTTEEAKEDAKQELAQMQGSITADEELDESLRIEIEAELRAAETAIENAKDATEVMEELAKVKGKIQEIKAKDAELKNARSEALNELDILETKLGEYRVAEQEKIRNAIEAAKTKIAAAADAKAVQDALAEANAVFEEQPTDAELTKREEENNKNKVTKITISAPSKKIAPGKKVALSTKVTPSNADDQRVQWSVDNNTYASVTKNGVVTVKKAGAGKSVKVTATALDGSDTKETITISIMKGAVKNVKLKAAKTVKVGKTLKIKATVSVTNKKANKTLKWATSNKKYATVNAKGVVSAKKAGKGKNVKITATATDGTNKKASVTIKIK